MCVLNWHGTQLTHAIHHPPRYHLLDKAGTSAPLLAARAGWWELMRTMLSRLPADMPKLQVRAVRGPLYDDDVS